MNFMPVGSLAVKLDVLGQGIARIADDGSVYLAGVPTYCTAGPSTATCSAAAVDQHVLRQIDVGAAVAVGLDADR